MKKVRVFYILKSPYLISRDMANVLAKYDYPEADFDFSKIYFVSAAFADEFLKNIPEEHIINAEKNIQEIFRAVRNRRKAAVSYKF